MLWRTISETGIKNNGGFQSTHSITCSIYLEASRTMKVFNPTDYSSLPPLSMGVSISSHLLLPYLTIYPRTPTQLYTESSLNSTFLNGSVKSYSLSDDRALLFIWSLNIWFFTLSLGSNTDLDGIEVKIFLVWLNVNEIFHCLRVFTFNLGS
ncbi:hypothetical protein R3W88_000906 [Solanum pinnatisectum]|uniref:Uncharacterized protein n=1 Tax=Solanum pinnatisectum TaxID=50273 RepID=A0AAV9MJP3_9SOLN|nr:hypothetical protein R3W88_000906 [Solanum pinnatisectum]